MVSQSAFLFSSIAVTLIKSEIYVFDGWIIIDVWQSSKDNRSRYHVKYLPRNYLHLCDNKPTENIFDSGLTWTRNVLAVHGIKSHKDNQANKNYL